MRKQSARDDKRRREAWLLLSDEERSVINTRERAYNRKWSMTFWPIFIVVSVFALLVCWVIEKAEKDNAADQNAPRGGSSSPRRLGGNAWLP